MAASDSTHDNSVPQGPYSRSNQVKNYQHSAPQRSAPQRSVQQSPKFGANAPNVPSNMQPSAQPNAAHSGSWSGYSQPNYQANYGPHGGYYSAAQVTAQTQGPLGPGLSTFGMTPVTPDKPRHYVPGATAAQEEYLKHAGQRPAQPASSEELAREFSAQLTAEQQRHAWPTDPAARTKVSVDELIAQAQSYSAQQRPLVTPPHAGYEPAPHAHSVMPDGASSTSNNASSGSNNVGQGIYNTGLNVTGGNASGGNASGDNVTGAVMSGTDMTGTSVATAQGWSEPAANVHEVGVAPPLAREVVALTPQQQLEQSIAERNAQGPEALIDPQLHGGSIALPDSGNKEQDEFAGFEQAAKLRREDRRRTQQAVSALDLLLKQIEERSGIKVDEVEVDPFEYYVIRKNEAQEVAAEVAQRQEEYFRNFMDKLRAEGKINAQCTFDTLQRDDLNRPAFTLGERFVRDISKQLSRKLFLLFGDMGTGKTMLVHAMANLFMDLKAQDPKLVQERTNTQMPLCLIATLDDLKRSWFYVSDESFEQRMERERKLKQYYGADLLVVDGLCSDFTALTPYNQRSFNDLLRHRSEHGLPLIVTTPLRMEALHRAVGDVVYEGFKSFEVTPTALLGTSRRAPISFNGTVLP